MENLINRKWRIRRMKRISAPFCWNPAAFPAFLILTQLGCPGSCPLFPWAAIGVVEVAVLGAFTGPAKALESFLTIFMQSWCSFISKRWRVELSERHCPPWIFAKPRQAGRLSKVELVFCMCWGFRVCLVACFAQWHLAALCISAVHGQNRSVLLGNSSAQCDFQ